MLDAVMLGADVADNYDGAGYTDWADAFSFEHIYC